MAGAVPPAGGEPPDRLPGGDRGPDRDGAGHGQVGGPERGSARTRVRDGQHRAPGDQPGVRDHPGRRRPDLGPGRRGEVDAPVPGGPGARRRLEPPEQSAGPAHRPGPSATRSGSFRGDGRGDGSSGEGGDGGGGAGSDRAPRRTGRAQQQDGRHHHHRRQQCGERKPSPDPGASSHGRSLAAACPAHHPLPDSCGQTAPVDNGCPSDGCTGGCTEGCTDGCTGAAIRWTSGSGDSPPALVDRPAGGAAAPADPPAAGPPPLTESPAPRRFPYTSHATRSAGSTSHAPPPVDGCGSSAAPARCECRSVRRARPVPDRTGASGSARSGRQAWLSPGRHGQTEPDPAGRSRASGERHRANRRSLRQPGRNT